MRTLPCRLKRAWRKSASIHVQCVPVAAAVARRVPMQTRPLVISLANPTTHPRSNGSMAQSGGLSVPIPRYL
ncbi:hypothetical protein M433DRAFT_378958 [Acidomyces richmondensis BFW]|nr:hypothetical protein M433DRAFT_378958 [Acidomyces richmondensis BFW]